MRAIREIKIKGKEYHILKGIKNRLIFRLGELYRWYILNVNRGKLKEYLAMRKGKCNNCGLCCGDCKLLIEKNGKKFCKDFPNTAIVTGCYAFPHCPMDLKKLGLEGRCGFYWLKNKDE